MSTRRPRHGHHHRQHLVARGSRWGSPPLLLLILLPLTAPLSQPAPSPPTLRDALAATKGGPPAAAAALWREVLESQGGDAFPVPVRASAYNTLGELLGRCGRDLESIDALDTALKLDPTAATAHSSRGHALHRLFRYREAHEAHLEASRCEEGAGREAHECQAAAALLRAGDVEAAIELLRPGVASRDSSFLRASDLSTRGLLGAALLMRCGGDGDKSSVDGKAEACGHLKEATSAALASGNAYAWLYAWLWRASGATPGEHLAVTAALQGELLIPLIAVNSAPVDASHWLEYDNKIWLHRLLDGGDGAGFWPEGYILPEQAAEVAAVATAQAGRWVLKEASGWGGHGNRFVTLGRSEYEGENAAGDLMSQEGLLQRYVEPQTLLNGRKFSLRLYVLTLGRDIYLCREGLVKTAADGVDVTNSGRNNEVAGMREDGQFDLKFLESHFEAQGWNYDALFRELTSLVARSMRGMRTWEGTLVEGVYALDLPKILGFDVLLDSDRKPWLIEVNRQPGLAAREEVDRRIKAAVVEGAWRLAAQRALGDTYGVGLFGEEPLFDSGPISERETVSAKARQSVENFVFVEEDLEQDGCASISTADVHSDDVAAKLLEEYRRKTAASAARRPSLPDDGRDDDAGGVKATGEPSCDPSRVIQTGDSDWIEVGSGYGEAQV